MLPLLPSDRGRRCRCLFEGPGVADATWYGARRKNVAGRSARHSRKALDAARSAINLDSAQPHLSGSKAVISRVCSKCQIYVRRAECLQNKAPPVQTGVWHTGLRWVSTLAQGWSDEDKASFLDRLRSLDPEFIDKLSSVPNGTADHSPTAPPMPPATTTVLVNHCTSVTVNGDSLKVDDDEEVEEEEEEGNREVVSPTEEPQPMPRNVVSPSAGSVEEERVSPLVEKIEYEEQEELVL
ncbi:hypothetical protein HPB51_000561 [Rhipicephalus microplus]|uniref:Uncharacterized protein n=1 Tax=Rhipicephalus microplus TaxID=6941 RepID=A0A9J6DXK1_RHIMP|nr:hypothetical protein HPB51_000561 [Rhipicephalus microplus]